MAFIRNCIICAVIALCIFNNAKAQTVYYPALSSQLLKATAEDMAGLLQKAIPGSHFITQAYSSAPLSGIVLSYDNSITDNQACLVQSDGSNGIKFLAAEDNGLHFGVYQYLYQLGFRFYQPGSIWEVIPSLTSSYKKIDTAYTTSYKYKTWFISGGHNRWVMDNNTAYNWDTYFGDNGHNWALYQRRNGMTGAYSFRGHRGDMMSGAYLTTLQNNPCYVANYNGSRAASVQSVPDINNAAATDLWASTIEQKYTQYKNTIFNNSNTYINISKNFSYNYSNVGIEVPDGARWGNSKLSDVCAASDYPKESDQHFTLANITAEKILAKQPAVRMQLYAYSAHADVPSSSITINKNIDIQLIPAVYQLESSTNGLRNRWYNRSSNVSEYQYLNLSGWSGETPSFNWTDLKNTLAIVKEKKTQGVVWETSPSKFASLPYLMAANNALVHNTDVDNTLQEFCDNMFADAAPTLYKMLQLWGNEKSAPNKYRLQLYINLLSQANSQVQNAAPVVKERMLELKAYLHYMSMYFDAAANDMEKTSKADKDAALCIYLAKINKLQLVNSYYLINMLAAKYGSNSEFYVAYNITNGTAYANGTLPLITAAEIENNFKEDVSKYGSRISGFMFEEAATAKNQFKTAGLAPLAKISAQLGYTNGTNYYGKTAYQIIAPAAGKFTIDYTPRFDMSEKGYINFLVESTDKALQVIKDFTIDNTSGAGSIIVNLPAAGNYMLTIVSKYKTAADINITTNGNYFYKSSAFLGSKTETYKTDAASLPGYFYIPQGINKIYFSVNNSFSNSKYAGAEMISNSFGFKDNAGNSIQAKLVSGQDSSLFYLEIPATASGNFCQASTMGTYNLQFVNISNQLWYAQKQSTAKKNTGEENVLNEPVAAIVPVMFPNPSAGIFNCRVNGIVTKADEVAVYSLQGTKVGSFRNTSQFNISSMSAGLYIYQISVNGVVYKGKIIKQ
jgi:Secretion system C-terminal sorting domain